jgi:uncharacterized protein
MPLIFNLRHLEKHELQLEGELSAKELELTDIDEMARLTEPVAYELVVERMGDSVLVQGSLTCTLNCQCVRCLRPFNQRIEIDDWTCNLPLEGEEHVAVNNDCVDLTPYVREDILLAFPQHPLCEPGCRGLPKPGYNLNRSPSVERQANETASAWAELNKLKF